jgi:hypothetical protein
LFCTGCSWLGIIVSCGSGPHSRRVSRGFSSRSRPSHSRRASTRASLAYPSRPSRPA